MVQVLIALNRPEFLHSCKSFVKLLSVNEIPSGYHLYSIYGGKTLHALFQNDPELLQQLPQILFQIIFGIFCLHKVLKRRHYDLHEKNIVLQRRPRPYRFTYVVGELEWRRRWQFQSAYCVTILDPQDHQNEHSKTSESEALADLNRLLHDIRRHAPPPDRAFFSRNLDGLSALTSRKVGLLPPLI